MTGGWDATAKALLCATLLCFVGGCGGLLFLGSYPVGTFVGAALVMAMMAYLLGALGLAAAFALTGHVRLRRHLNRPVLSDEEFIALLPNPAEIDPEVVRPIRRWAARRFCCLGGARFYPDDRLEEDLHLPDLAPWAVEDLWYELLELTGAGEEELATAGAAVKTFGDVVVLASRLRRGE
jgi:hypothetical protein